MKKALVILILVALCVGCLVACDQICFHRDGDADEICDVCGNPMNRQTQEMTSDQSCQHDDEDQDGICDSCGDAVLEEISTQQLFRDHYDWMYEITAEDIAEVKITFRYVGVVAGVMIRIQRSADREAIARIFEGYYNLEMTLSSEQEAAINGGSSRRVDFTLQDGTVKTFGFYNGFCSGKNDTVFRVYGFYGLGEDDSTVDSYQFTTHRDVGNIYDCDPDGESAQALCEISVGALEFVALEEDEISEDSAVCYYVTTEFGTLYFFSESDYYTVESEEYISYYRLVGKTVAELIAENGGVKSE